MVMTSKPCVHVIGAGLAGLQAALALVEAGRQVVLYEAGPVAGGRCRSFYDRRLGCRIDNGNHLLLSGNSAAYAYLDRLGSRYTMGGPGEAAYPFVDLTSGERWIVKLSDGRIPWWIFSRRRRVPGTSLRDYLRLLSCLRPSPEATLASVTGDGPLVRRLIDPLAVASLNTPSDQSSAALFAAVIAQTLMQGGEACIPAFPRIGLSESFVDPAISRLRARGAAVYYSRRISGLRLEAERIAALATPDGPIVLAADDQVVLAVPPWVAADLLPKLAVPDAFEAIVNIHFRVAASPGPARFIGLIGGTAEWVFVKDDVVSVTISAANRLAEASAEVLVAATWPEVRMACGLAEGMAPPAWRVLRERRATFAATPAQELRRPGSRTGLANLALAGDWTATGLPATIEGAIRSGQTAATLLLHAA
jgi:squalene-associated FAD-dependent desaturase